MGIDFGFGVVGGVPVKGRPPTSIYGKKQQQTVKINWRSRGKGEVLVRVVNQVVSNLKDQVNVHMVVSDGKKRRGVS